MNDFSALTNEELKELEGKLQDVRKEVERKKADAYFASKGIKVKRTGKVPPPWGQLTSEQIAIREKNIAESKRKELLELARKLKEVWDEA